MKIKQFAFIAIVFMPFLSASHQAQAKTIRAHGCGQDFVRIGDSKWDVIAKCGEPLHTEVISGDSQNKKELLVYNAKLYPAHKKLIFSFESGQLEEIKLTN
ncbi:DUF2845 domain-containing protein [Catenovulum agarivorans]|uniref:DUF2845 domain-containing protein n=1 Tax=Catenovulum agarivorans TaxID=1172192 RepID=UPI0002DA770C|nr:DUF2845 domain-containing protein [Catenovulum agarivorans]